MNKKIIIWITLGLLLVFLVREFWLQSNNNLEILGEKNLVMIKNDNLNFYFNKNENSSIKYFGKSLNSYFLSKNIDVFGLEIGQNLITKNSQIYKLSQNIVLGKFREISVIFFDDDFSETEINNIKNIPINLNNDFWVINKNIYPNFLPFPKTAILYLNDRKPSEKFKKFVFEKNIPLITWEKTGGFWLKLNKDLEIFSRL